MKKHLGLAALVAISLAAPLLIYPVFLMKALCFAIFASSLNLLLGCAGLLSFGHAALFGGAAYAAGYAMKAWGLPTELGLLTGMAAGAFLGFVFGALASRCQGIYFAMITFALAQMIYFIAVQAEFTGGEDGLQSVPRGELFGIVDVEPTFHLYYVTLVVFALAMFAMYRIVNSPFGLVLRMIHDNDARATSLGYSVNLYKVIAFALSGAFAGLAGAMKTLVFQFASLSDVYWHTNGEVVLMTVLGGIGTQLGPAIGAFVVVIIQNYFAEAGAWVTIIQGGVFVVVVLAFRRGIVGEFTRMLPILRDRLRVKKASPSRASTNALSSIIKGKKHG
jgi:branched-chain amino acid transport system permease protein